MDLIYHGCMKKKNADGTNNFIVPGEKCLVPTEKCFWKDSQDVRNYRVKTRSCTKKDSTVNIRDYDNYMRQRQWINRMASWYRAKGQMILLIALFILIVLVIVSNGNILTDRTDGRKYNDL